MSDESNDDAEGPSRSGDPEPFRGDSPFDEDNPFDDASEGERPDFGPMIDDDRSTWAIDPSLGLMLARSWTKRHQKAVMLGAFAAGVFAGSLMRD